MTGADPDPVAEIAAITAARAVLDAHIVALNARDPAALAATLHFPHFRLSGTALRVWDTPDTYFADFRDRAGGDWAQSRFEDVTVQQSAGDKVHFSVCVVRQNHAGKVIARFASLWVVTCEGGRWAAKFRSTFAPV